ncbi:MAG: hypothetical protein WBC44_17375 [Planctomycetaceae bacterium]
MFLDGIAPYALPPAAKRDYLLTQLTALQRHHAERCPPYARLVVDWERRGAKSESIEDLPFLPVTVFKEHDLRSGDGDAMAVRSSATTSGVASRVYSDKETRKRQSRSANRIWVDFVGEERRPYLVFDLEETVRGIAGLGARGAAILSLAHLASEFHFVMRSDGNRLRLDADALLRAVEAIGDRSFLAYGFTYLLHQAHVELHDSGNELPPAHPESRLLHSGGWKRLQANAIDKVRFNDDVSRPWQLPASAVTDFYGLVEQVGVPYPDCSEGLKHAPYWAEVIVRRTDTLTPAGVGETGLIQLMNCLPLSGPHHNVLTEDLGETVVEDGCACGRRGRAFRFVGRAPRAELRGCSDVAQH